MPTNTRFIKFRSRFSRLRGQREKKGLPLWAQWVGILSGLASFGLAIYLISQKVSIEKMETLLENQKNQTDQLIALNSKQQDQTAELLKMNKKQESAINILTDQIQELKKISSVSILTSKKLTDQIIAIKNQTSYLYKFYTPDVSVTKMDFFQEKPESDSAYQILTFKNFGGRSAVKFVANIYFITLENDLTTITARGTTSYHGYNVSHSIPPGGDFTDPVFIELSENNGDREDLGRIKIGYEVIKITYLDPLTNKQLIKKFFFNNNVNDGPSSFVPYENKLVLDKATGN